MSSMGNLNLEEERAIEELQMRVKKNLTPKMREEDTVFYRFLKARDFDVDKAEKMLCKHLQWRKIYRIDIIQDHLKPSSCFLDYLMPSHIGYDRDGDVVMYTPIGKMEIYDILKSIKVHDLVKNASWFIEKHITLVQAHNEATGKKGYRANLIFDLDKLTIATATAKHSLSTLLRLTNMYQDNYPERLKSVYVINAPSYYVFAWTVLKTVMSNALINKIHIFGYNGWKEHLLKFCDADILPAFLGGNRTDPDGNPLCKSFMNFSGKISERYFLTDEERYFTDNSKVKKIYVPSSEKREVIVDTEEVGSVIQWEFMVKGKDIGFGLFYKVSENKKLKEIIPIQKYDFSDGSEKDSHKCEFDGRYVIVFDNSYSWLSSKDVDFCIDVKKPEPVVHAKVEQT